MYKFNDVKFLTAKKKTMILKNWISFLKFLTLPEWDDFNQNNGGSDHGLEAPKQFTKRLYEHLSLHCGFIAHYNIHGFYSEYFSGDRTDLERFFANFDSPEGENYNSNSCWGDYRDIGEAMVKEYLKVKDKMFIKAQNKNDDKFELLKECIKRSEKDINFRNQFLNKIL